MKRDMDIVRQVLLAIESIDDPDSGEELEIEGVEPNVVSYHLELLHEAGFIEAEDVGGLGTYGWVPRRLTWQGHEFLDSARNDTIWRKAKERTAAVGGAVALDVFKAVLVRVAMQTLGVA